MKFGLYLVRNGVISADQLVAALEFQHRKYVPIGQLAIEERLMSARDVFHVLHYQSDAARPRERFGEIAVEMGLISQDELQRLLLLQMDRRPQLMDVLIRQGILTADEVAEHKVAFRRELDRGKTVTTRRLPLTTQCGAVPRFPAGDTAEVDVESYAVMV